MIQIDAAEAISTDEDPRRLERTRLRAVVGRDFEVARTLRSLEFHLITPRGSTYTCDSYLRAVEVGGIVDLQREAADILIRRCGGGALLHYRDALDMPGASGGPESFACWHTDADELPNGRWQVVRSQATGIREHPEKHACRPATPSGARPPAGCACLRPQLRSNASRRRPLA